MTKTITSFQAERSRVSTILLPSQLLCSLRAMGLLALLLLVSPIVFGQQSGVAATYTGTSATSPSAAATGASPRATAATPNPTAIVFGTVALATSAPPQLTASFAVSGYSGTFTPTAVTHYGLDYTLGPVSCTGTSPSETCTVVVTFNPTLPGVRRDALFLMNGTTRLATVLISGIGQAPMALVQPGTYSAISTLPTSNYYYGSTVDENGTVYVIQGTNIDSITAAGVVTVLPLTGLRNFTGLAIDGAGVLYIACSNGCSSGLATYDTVLGIQGTVSIPGTASNPVDVAVGTSGNVFALDEFGPAVYKVQPDGTVTKTAISISINQPSHLAIDATENQFIGGYIIGEITAGGSQTSINAVGATDGLAVDAADTVYATRYTGTNGVAELPASNYSTPQAALDNGSPLGLSLGSNGTLYVGNYNVLDKVDRGSGVIDFGAQFPGNTFTTASTTIYNGGNQPLVFSAVTITGSAFQFVTLSGTNCTTGTSLPPGAICSIGISASPSHAGVSTGTLTVTTNSLNRTAASQTTTLTVTQYGPYLVPTSSPLNFPNQAANTASNPVVETLTNQGAFPGLLTTATSSNPAFTVDISSCTTALQPNATCSISVVFKPTAAQAYAANITLTYQDTQNRNTLMTTFPVAGTGIAAPTPQALVSATAVGFSNQIVNTTSGAQAVALSNSGNGVLNVSGINITGTGAASFAQTNNCGSSVAAGGSCTLSITFTPSTATGYTASLSIADNASGSPQTVSLTGTGIPVPAPVISLAPASLTFPGTTVGTTSTPQNITLSNTGNAVLNISSISLAGTNASSFAIGGTCGSTLAAGSSCAITITFTPVATSSLAATLTIADNAAGSPHQAALTGAGVAPPTPQAVLSPASLTFSAITVGTTSATQTIMLSNPGTGSLSISGIALGGPNASSFAQTNTCGATLAVAATCSINVTFSPSATGSLSALLSVTDNAAASPHTATLSGTGTASDFSLTTGSSSQTIPGSGGTAQYTFSASGTSGTYSSPIAFTVTGLPTGVTAVFAPPTITPGNTTATTTLTLTIASLAGDMVVPAHLPRSGGHNVPVLPVTAAGLLFCFFRRRRIKASARHVNLLCIAGLLLTFSAITGCSDGFTPKNVVTPGTYNLTVTGTSTTGQHSTSITLIVQ